MTIIITVYILLQAMIWASVGWKINPYSARWNSIKADLSFSMIAEDIRFATNCSIHGWLIAPPDEEVVKIAWQMVMLEFQHPPPRLHHLGKWLLGLLLPASIQSCLVMDAQVPAPSFSSPSPGQIAARP